MKTNLGFLLSSQNGVGLKLDCFSIETIETEGPRDRYSIINIPSSFMPVSAKNVLNCCRRSPNIIILWMIDWLFFILRPSQNVNSSGHVTVTDEELQNLSLCWALMAIEQVRDLYRVIPVTVGLGFCGLIWITVSFSGTRKRY